MVKNGCQIIEPEAIEEWLGAVKNKEFLVALLNWLVIQFRLEFNNKYPLIRIEVVVVNYHGAYPAIGVWGGSDISDDLADQIDILTKKALEEKSLSEFIKFVLNTNNVWSEVATKLLDNVQTGK